MANTIAVQDILARYVAATFRNENHFLRLAMKPFQSDYDNEINGYNVGATVRFRLPTYTNVRYGVVAQPQNLIERETAISLNRPIGADWNPNLLQLTTDMDSNDQIYQRFAEPSVIKLANAVDQSVASGLMSSVYNVSGTAGATVGSWAAFDLAKTKLIKLGVQPPYFCVLNPSDRHYLQASMVNFFNSSFNEDIGVKGVLGETSGVMCYEDQNLTSHTNGSFPTGGTITVKTTSVTGATSIVLQGFTASQTGVLLAGDIIRVAGVYAVNILNQVAIGTATEDLMGFIVTANVNSDGSGDATVPISPVITFESGNPYNNVSALPAASAAVTLVGGASATYTNNFIFSRDAILMAMKKYFRPFVPAGSYGYATDDKTGATFSVMHWFDGNNFTNLIRLDLLYGFKILPEYAVRLIG